MDKQELPKEFDELRGMLIRPSAEVRTIDLIEKINSIEQATLKQREETRNKIKDLESQLKIADRIARELR